MKIYRLETKEGYGVYRVMDEANLAEDYYGGAGTRHPAPWRDSKFNQAHTERFGRDAHHNDFSDKYVFGFSCPKQMLRWFFNRGDLEVLETKHAIQLSVYECNDVLEGNTQVAFGIWHHTLFTPVEVMKPTEFYDKFSAEADLPMKW